MEELYQMRIAKSILTSSISHDNSHPILRPQRHRRIDRDRMIGNQLQPKLLANRRQHQDDLHHRKRSADAGSWATTKREVGVLWKSCFKLFSPAFRFKIRRLIVKASIALR